MNAREQAAVDRITAKLEYLQQAHEFFTEHGAYESPIDDDIDEVIEELHRLQQEGWDNGEWQDDDKDIVRTDD